jgi:hypothetical protein
MGCCSYCHFFVDTRMNTKRAGEKKLNKNCEKVFPVLLVGTVKTKTHKKFNISLPAELHDWCVKKQSEEQEKTAFGKIHLSNIVAKAVEEMMQSESKKQRSDSTAKHKIARPARNSSASLKQI